MLLALIPRLLTAGRFVTTNERTWISRSVRFSDGIASFDLSQATDSVGELSAIPGAPLMWIGTAARVVWAAAHGVGLADDSRFVSPDGLAVAQYLSAIVIALLIGALVLVTARWAGLVPALLAAGLVSTEPWFVGLGAVLHSDEMMALLGTIGLVLLARVLDIPQTTDVVRSRLTAALAGAALMGSALTKLTGAGFWIGAAVLAFFNSALGGGEAGRDTLLVGWGEGLDLARDRIEELEHGNCSDMSVRGLETLWLSGWPCTTPPMGDEEPNYVVLYVNQLQRNPSARDPVKGRELIDIVEIRGITYAEIWR